MARPTLKKGMSGKKGTEVGEAILLWRMFLGKPELKPAPGTTNYDFGSATDKATREFQTAAGITANGIVDDITWAAYDAKMASAHPVVQAKAKAAETQAVANVAAAQVAKQVENETQRVAAMTAAVQGKTAPKAKQTAKTSPTPSSGTTPEDTAANIAWYKKAQKSVATKSKAAALKTKEKVESMTIGGVITAGVIALAALVGYKVVKKPA